MIFFISIISISYFLRLRLADWVSLLDLFLVRGAVFFWCFSLISRIFLWCDDVPMCDDASRLSMLFFWFLFHEVISFADIISFSQLLLSSFSFDVSLLFFFSIITLFFTCFSFAWCRFHYADIDADYFHAAYWWWFSSLRHFSLSFSSFRESIASLDFSSFFWCISCISMISMLHFWWWSSISSPMPFFRFDFSFDFSSLIFFFVGYDFAIFSYFRSLLLSRRIDDYYYFSREISDYFLFFFSLLRALLLDFISSPFSFRLLDIFLLLSMPIRGSLLTLIREHYFWFHYYFRFFFDDVADSFSLFRLFSCRCKSIIYADYFHWYAIDFLEREARILLHNYFLHFIFDYADIFFRFVHWLWYFDASFSFRLLLYRIISWRHFCRFDIFCLCFSRRCCYFLSRLFLGQPIIDYDIIFYFDMPSYESFRWFIDADFDTPFYFDYRFLLLFFDYFDVASRFSMP